MRKALIACLALAVAALAVVAAAPSSTSTAAALPGCAKDSLNLHEPGTFTIGTDNPAFPPWFGGGEKTKPWKLSDPYSGKGYESAVAYAVAAQLGFSKAQVKWTPLVYTNSYKPGKKDFDVYLAQISYLPARAKNATFSSPYYYVNQAIVGIKGTPIASAKSIAGLRKYKLGAAIGTTSYDFIVKQIKPSSQPSVFDSNSDAVSALKNKQIDGLVVDYPSTGYITGVQVPTATVIGRFAPVGTKEYFGMVLQKGNPLVACVNKALANLRANGTLTRLERVWLGKGGAPILK
jgi:polar amino acid transport system substrate-binding protein